MRATSTAAEGKNEPSDPASDIKKFFRPQIRPEPGFGNHIFPQLQSKPGGNKGTASVGNIGERSPMDQYRGMFQGLD